MSEFKNFKLKDESVVLTKEIENVIAKCDEFFSDLPCIITDGLRSRKRIVEMIISECKKRGISFPEMGKALEVNPENTAAYFKNGYETYAWHRAYCALIKTGFKINPPCDVRVLDGANFDNETKVIKSASRHLSGLAFDISGREKMSEKLKRFQDVLIKGDSGIMNVYPEREQNCIHVNVRG